MPQQVAVSVENNFTKGLITQSIGLNFPENAATDTDNCEYTLIGEVLRREGMNYEANFATLSNTKTNKAINTYKWNNAGGDGINQLMAAQIGDIVYFYDVDNATTVSPLSSQRLASTINLPTFAVTTFDATAPCEFADGNGYLFIFHPSCDPIAVTLSSGVVAGQPIQVNIRDFAGISETGIADNTRPSSLTASHQYNLQNQGWTSGNPWTASSTSTVAAAVGAQVWTVQSGLTITPGQTVLIAMYTTNGLPPPFTSNVIAGYETATVTSYSGTTLTMSVSYVNNYTGSPSYSIWAFTPSNTGFINTWQTAIGNYPSNADQWWRFKNSSGAFDPATTVANTSIGLGAAPKGHYIIPAFTQTRTGISGVQGITDIITTARPTNGCWFQQRVWYTGVKASQAPSGTASFTSWTENIYFSQIIQKPEDFGKCYQTNDPTAQDLFDLLPTDGGVIVIQGSGAIYKLFPTQNGLLVFAGNGVWYITGSQGIGFTANDYTITKISSVQSISTSSYVDVLGMPYFWNEEGIYQVKANQNGSLSVESITVTTILDFFANIPLSSKKRVRGAYNPVEYIIQWAYCGSEPATTTAAYQFDKILNYSTANQAFFPYTINITNSSFSSIAYVSGPGGGNTPPPTFKYFCSDNSSNWTFAELWDSNFVDWASSSNGGANYVSYFITGYKLRGQAIKKFQPQYIQVWSNIYPTDSGYKIQGVWDYSLDRNSNRFSSIQNAYFDGSTYYKAQYKRHKIRGQGYALQFKIISQDGKPFDVIGWAIVDTVNAGT
mgnify:CR=1 FL=1